MRERFVDEFPGVFGKKGDSSFLAPPFVAKGAKACYTFHLRVVYPKKHEQVTTEKVFVCWDF